MEQDRNLIMIRYYISDQNIYNAMLYLLFYCTWMDICLFRKFGVQFCVFFLQTKFGAFAELWGWGKCKIPQDYRLHGHRIRYFTAVTFIAWIHRLPCSRIRSLIPMDGNVLFSDRNAAPYPRPGISSGHLSLLDTIITGDHHARLDKALVLLLDRAVWRTDSHL